MFGELLPNIDLIGVPVAMNLFGREKAKTRFGGICSIFFFGFVAWSIYNTGLELFSTVNPKIISYEFYKDDPRAITISRENFPVGFAMMTPDTLNYRPYKDPSIFTIEITHLMVERTHTEDGRVDEKWTETKILTENCTKDYFGEQASSLVSMNLNSVYCIAEEQPELDKLEIQGVYSSDVYQAIIVAIKACDNSTSNGTCASEQKINQYLSGGWLNMVYVNMVVNPQNYTSPNNTYKDIWYTMISPNNYREVEFDLGYVEISTDSGWLTESYTTKTYTKLNKVTEYLHTAPHPEKILISCTLKVGQLETYYTRSYKKVQGVIAEAAGMANVALIMMAIATAPFMKIKFRESLMNELFDVRVPTKSKNKNSQPKKPKKGCNLKLNIEKTPSTENNMLTHRKSELAPYITSYPDDRDSHFPETPALKSPVSFERTTLFDFQVSKESKNMAESPTRNQRTPVKSILSGRMTRKPLSINQKDPLSINNKAVSSETEAKVDDINDKFPEKMDISEGKRKQIKSSRNLNTKIGLSTKNKMTKSKVKSLNDDSLHLSFDSESEGSDLESPKKNELKNKQIIIEIPERKDSEEKTAEIVAEDKKEKIANDVKETPRETKSFIDKVKELHSSGLKKMDVSIWQYISWLLCDLKSQRREKKVFTEGLRQVNERLDIINVMKKLREVDKFRALLLDPDQLLLFNNMPKPIIQHETEYFKNNLSNSYSRLQSLRFVDEVITEDQINNSINSIRRKTNKSEIDKRLIEIFESKNSQGF